MKTFHQFQESIEQRRQQLANRQKDSADNFKSRSKQYTANLQSKRDDEEDRKRLKDEIKKELASEVYDPEIQGRSQIKRVGSGEKIGSERKKTPDEMRRKKAIGGGKFEPIAPYKPRKDIGTQRPRSEREQSPTQERGSAREKQLAAAKAERKAAAQARIAAKKSGGAATTAKPKSKEAEKKATELLRKKSAPKTAAPGYTPQKASGLSRKERIAVTKKGQALLRDLVIQSEREKGKKVKTEKDLKHKYTSS